MRVTGASRGPCASWIMTDLRMPSELSGPSLLPGPPAPGPTLVYGDLLPDMLMTSLGMPESPIAGKSVLIVLAIGNPLSSLAWWTGTVGSADHTSELQSLR